MTMKTVREWFMEMLPQDVADKAIKYALDDIIDTESPMLFDALMDAFIWDTTEEGHDYWDDIVEKFATSV